MARTGLRARLAATPGEVRAAQALRHLCFREARGLPPRPDGLDRDGQDPDCLHLVGGEGGEPVATARLRLFPDRAAAEGGYAAGTHDLGCLPAVPGLLAEIGRVCVRPGAPEAAALRALWGGLTRIADAEGVGLLFGCSSFEGADPAPHLGALALLGHGHLAPGASAPRAAETLDLAALPPPLDRAAALRGVPPLLRTYLAMGGRVGRHAVVDRELATIHVLTLVETAAVPPARARALRALASGGG